MGPEPADHDLPPPRRQGRSDLEPAAQPVESDSEQAAHQAAEEFPGIENVAVPDPLPAAGILEERFRLGLVPDRRFDGTGGVDRQVATEAPDRPGRGPVERLVGRVDRRVLAARPVS
jgi:hypothetical protein